MLAPRRVSRLRFLPPTPFQGSEAGVIERIELVDFMCHRKLDVRLSPNVNFILGRNGSELKMKYAVVVLPCECYSRALYIMYIYLCVCVVMALCVCCHGSVCVLSWQPVMNKHRNCRKIFSFS